MIYPNLEAEMTREGITKKDISEFLGKSTVTISNWMNGGAGEFPVGAAMRMKAELFPNCSVEYLFERK